MTIKEEEFAFLQGEKEIRTDIIFLEKGEKSSSYIGRGVPRGKLILTEKHLVFLSKDTGDSLKKHMGKVVVGLIVGAIDPFGFADLGEYALDKVKNRKMDLEPVLKSEFSFIIPAEQITGLDKTGLFSREKVRTLKIRIKDNDGIESTYCIYKKPPRKTLSGLVNFGKWEKAFKKVGVKKN